MQPFKKMVLAIDPKATIRVENPGGDAYDLTQWRVYDGAGELIGYSNPSTERRSSYAWMRAYWALDRRSRQVKP